MTNESPSAAEAAARKALGIALYGGIDFQWNERGNAALDLYRDAVRAPLEQRIVELERRIVVLAQAWDRRGQRIETLEVALRGPELAVSAPVQEGHDGDR